MMGAHSGRTFVLDLFRCRLRRDLRRSAAGALGGLKVFMSDLSLNVDLDLDLLI